MDITGTCNITNSLSCMQGFGYLFTGDYFKGTCDYEEGLPKINDDFIVINKLTLSFIRERLFIPL